jgi:hypothetical protein
MVIEKRKDNPTQKGLNKSIFGKYYRRFRQQSLAAEFKRRERLRILFQLDSQDCGQSSSDNQRYSREV